MKIKFKIDKEIYSKKDIKQAIVDFTDVSEITFDDWILTIKWENEAEINLIFNEFMNYIIWLFNEQ